MAKRADIALIQHAKAVAFIKRARARIARCQIQSQPSTAPLRRDLQGFLQKARANAVPAQPLGNGEAFYHQDVIWHSMAKAAQQRQAPCGPKAAIYRAHIGSIAACKTAAAAWSFKTLTADCHAA
jgi:hypothetical protein